MTNDVLNDEPDADVQLTPREELSEVLKRQPERIGQIHRLLEDGKSPQEVGEILDLTPSSANGYIAEYNYAIKAILDGEIPRPSQVIRTARKLNSFAKRTEGELTDAASQLLTRHQEAILAVQRKLEPAAISLGEREAEEAEKTDINYLNIPGIYAFSYGHYLDYPAEPNTGNTLIKVGKADDVASRIAQYRGGIRTHIPEPLITLRVYKVPTENNLDDIERQFHNLLKTAGHRNPHYQKTTGRNEIGREWFLTNADFLDQIALALKLPLIFATN